MPFYKAEGEKIEYDLIQAMIDARISQNITQKELSELTGITQADISGIENGTRNPSLAMVKRISAVGPKENKRGQVLNVPFSRGKTNRKNEVDWVYIF